MKNKELDKNQIKVLQEHGIDLDTEDVSHKNLVKIKRTKKVFSKLEGNLIEYPLAVLNKQGIGSFVEGNFVVYKDKGNNTVSKVGTPYGVLTSFDENIFVGMMSFLQEVNGKYLLPFYDYSLLKRLGFKTAGSMYKLLEKSKKKIATITFSMERFYKKSGKAKSAVEGYPLFTGYYITSSTTTLDPLQCNFYQLNPLIAENIAEKYLFYINMEVWNSIPTPTGKRIYEYLIKKKGKKTFYEENIKGFCAKLPLETKNISRAKNILRVAFEDLKKRDIIADYNFCDGGKKIGVHFHKDKPKEKLLAKRLKNGQAEAFNKLLGLGVQQETALKLLQDIDLSIINRQLDWIHYRAITSNKAGMIYKAIVDNWTMPLEAENKLASRNEIDTHTREVNKEGLDAVNKLSATLASRNIEPSPLLKSITTKRAEITLEEIEEKFQTMKGFTSPSTYRDGVESIITRYSKIYSVEELRRLADKHKP